MGNSCGSNSLPHDYEHALLGDKSAPQSVPFGDEKQEHRGDIRRNVANPARLLTDPFGATEGEGNCRTIWAAWKRAAAKYPENPCLGVRPFVVGADGKYTVQGGAADEKEEKKAKAVPARGDYTYITYQQVDEQVRGYGAGLASLGLKPQDAVAIYSPNRAEWTIANLGNFSQGYRTVALYDTLGADAAQFIIGHAECKAIVLSKDKLKKTLQIIKGNEQVKVIIQFDVNDYSKNVEEILDAADVAAAAAQGVQLLSFSELVKKGKESGLFPVDSQPDDLAFIMYTSGTTGQPKGAMLSHGNILSAVASAQALFALMEKDVHVSYLPLAHIFESVVEVAMLAVGGSIAFYQGDVKKLVDDFKDAKVSILCGVPRVYERIYDRVQKRITENNCIKKWVANKAFREQAEAIRNGTRDAGWDDKVFIPMRTMMGLQHVRVIVSGAAPMAAYLAEFLRIVIGAPVCQGYGMTETSAATCIVNPNDVNVGHVGPPLQGSEICLEDVDEMNYKHSDVHPRGEILIRGPGVFKGYFKNEQATKDALTEDGWLHSGDVGRWNPNGTLSIIDRKKNMLKLSQGEYIALEKVEAAYKNLWCTQLCVYGNSYHSFLAAVVVPSAEQVVPWLQSKGWWPTGLPVSTEPAFLAEFKKQCEAHEADLNTEVHKAIMEQATANKLSSLEKVKSPLIFEFELDETLQGFTVNNDCITPTMKLKRNIIVKRYEEKLRKVYELNGEPAKAGEKW